MHVDVLELNFGYGLLQLVDQAAGGDLLDRITVIRQKTALELGLVIPTVRIRDDLQLKANDYAIKLKGRDCRLGHGAAQLDHADRSRQRDRSDHRRHPRQRAGLWRPGAVGQPEPSRPRGNGGLHRCRSVLGHHDPPG